MLPIPNQALISRCNGITDQIIGAAIEVHRHFGPGMLESAYEACLCHELSLRGVRYERQVAQSIEYKGLQLENGCRLDILVENLIVVELKSVERISELHEAQLLTYLKFSQRPLGLLLNFRCLRLKDGITRLLNPAAGDAINLL